MIEVEYKIIHLPLSSEQMRISYLKSIFFLQQD
jgi:hypothetical protein